ncbi:MAG TPA: hypothetical protein VF637_02890 [Sphingomicrobium sp.]
MQVPKVRELALLFLQARLPEGDDPDKVERLLADLNALISKRPEAAGFKDNRLDRSQRGARGLILSRQRYDKLFRLTASLEVKLAKLRVEEAKHRLLFVAKTGLAPQLTIEQLGGSVPTAAFVAHHAARMKLRRVRHRRSAEAVRRHGRGVASPLLGRSQLQLARRRVCVSTRRCAGPADRTAER